jgi:cleavage and polyadenylation specificity factor subunit 3
MFLEAQFGADNVGPVEEPKLEVVPKDPKKGPDQKKEEADSETSMDVSEDEEEAERLAKMRRQTELERLHRLGIPVPGVSIKVDKMEAKVWLEDLEVECSNKVFADRVRAVVERAVEVTAPLWG